MLARKRDVWLGLNIISVQFGPNSKMLFDNTQYKPIYDINSNIIRFQTKVLLTIIRKARMSRFLVYIV